MKTSNIAPVLLVGAGILMLISSTPSISFAGNDKWGQIIDKYSNIYKIPKALIYAIIRIESSGNPNSKSGDINGGSYGAMQISIETARDLGFTGTISQLYEPDNNIHYGVKYLYRLKRLFNGNVRKMAAGYNAGPDLIPYPYHYVNKFLLYYDMYAPRFGERAMGVIA